MANILVIENDVPFREHIAHFLSRAGHEVKIIDCNPQAVAKEREDAKYYSSVIIDLHALMAQLVSPRDLIIFKFVPILAFMGEKNDAGELQAGAESFRQSMLYTKVLEVMILGGVANATKMVQAKRN